MFPREHFTPDVVDFCESSGRLSKTSPQYDQAISAPLIPLQDCTARYFPELIRLLAS